MKMPTENDVMIIKIVRTKGGRGVETPTDPAFNATPKGGGHWEEEAGDVVGTDVAEGVAKVSTIAF